MQKPRIAWFDPALERSKKDVDYVAKKMVEGQYFSMLGPPFFGKARFLEQVRDRLLEERHGRYRCCFINIFNLLELSREDFFREILIGIRDSLKLSPDQHIGDPANPQEALLTTINGTRNRLFLFLANFDFLDDKLARELLLSLRAIKHEAQPKKNITVAVAGSQNLMELTIGATSPFNIAEVFPIRALTWEECRDFVEKKKLFHDSPIYITEETIAHLYQETAGQPYLVAKIINKAFNLHSNIDINAIEESIAAFIQRAPTKDDYMVNACRTLEEDFETFLYCLSYFDHWQEQRSYDHQTLTLTGIFKEKDRDLSIDNDVLRKYLEIHLTPTRRGDLGLLHGRWDIARKSYKATTPVNRQEFLRIKADRPLGRWNRLADLLRVFTDLLWHQEDPSQVQEVFMEGLQLLLNARKAVLYRLSPDEQRLMPMPGMYFPLDGEAPGEIEVYRENDALPSRAKFQKKLVFSLDCRRFAAPVGKSRSGESRFIEVHLDYHHKLERNHRQYIVEEAATLALSANMAYENARHLQLMEVNLEEKVRTLADIVERQKVLATIINCLQRQSSLEKKLYFVLTGLTIKHSLEFNRAMLFLWDDFSQELHGVLAIGSGTEEEHQRLFKDPLFQDTGGAVELVWKDFDQNPSLYLDNPLSKFIKSLRFPKDTAGPHVLLNALNEIKVHIIENSDPQTVEDDPFLRQLQSHGQITKEMAILPLISEDEHMGVICVDNRWDHRPISNEFLSIARLFAAQAAIIIQQDRLAQEQKQREIDFRRRKFLDMAAHELKTPVNILSWLAEKVQNDGFEKVDSDWLQNQTERLRFIVQNLIDTAAIEGGERITGERAPVPVGRFLEEIRQTMDRLCIESEHQLELINELPNKAFYLEPNWTKSVLINLLENARVHTPDKTKIRLLARQSKEWLEFVVEDEGPGIHPKDLAAFMAFGAEIPAAPGHRARIRLGLKIVKTVIEELEGKFAMENRPEGGLRVTISLKKEAYR